MHPTGICPRCEDPIDGRHGRVFCRPCAKERITLINRNRMRARRRGLPPPLRICVLCPHEVGKKELYCPPCRRSRRQAAMRIYHQRPEVKARNRERAQRPKQKLAAYARAQRPEVRARKRERDNARYQPTTPHEAKCKTLMCEGTFTRTRWNGRRMFCEECRRLFGIVPKWGRSKQLRRAA